MDLETGFDKTVVVGLGVTGLSCARYFERTHQCFSIVDSRTNPPCLDVLRAELPNVALTLGSIGDESIAGADRLVVSPGVSLEEPAIAKAIENGVVVCGDIDIFRSQVSAPIVAITGSNGKSTVTTLVGKMAEKSGKTVAVGGNLGVPVLDLIAEIEPDLYVLELSSFQLERSRGLNAEVATVLNISADHMDRYRDIDAYRQAKYRVFEGCEQIVINRADSLTAPLISEYSEISSFALDRPSSGGFGLIVGEGEEEGIEFIAYEFEPLMAVSELKIVGRHNLENALAALALGHAVSLDFDSMLDALREFPGLEHRCQHVADIDGVAFYNDSKGTNVGAAVASINGISENAGKIILIAGGEAKGAEFDALLPALKNHVRAVVVIGEAANQLAETIGDSAVVQRESSMDLAVLAAFKLANSGDAVLLSPACASFDMFDNYQHRGEVFVKAVEEILEGCR